MNMTDTIPESDEVVDALTGKFLALYKKSLDFESEDEGTFSAEEEEFHDAVEALVCTNSLRVYRICHALGHKIVDPIIEQYEMDGIDEDTPIIFDINFIDPTSPELAELATKTFLSEISTGDCDDASETFIWVIENSDDELIQLQKFIKLLLALAHVDQETSENLLED
jgi:hypothetical protein